MRVNYCFPLVKVSTISIIVGAIFNCIALAETEENRKEIYEQLNLFGEVFDRVRATHVESVKSKDLIRAAIDGMLSSLDPHSGYLPPESFEDMQVDNLVINERIVDLRYDMH